VGDMERLVEDKIAALKLSLGLDDQQLAAMMAKHGKQPF
jgi:hypothetical protein